MSGVRQVLWTSLVVTVFVFAGGAACSGSDSGAGTASDSDAAISNADPGCRKFCSDQANPPLGVQCLDSQGESHALPEALCNNLCMNPKCSPQPGASWELVQAFFDCAKTASKSLCDTANGVAQPVGCASQQGLLSWISGWEYDGKKSVCN